MLQPLRHPHASLRRLLLVLLAALGLAFASLAVAPPAHAVVLPTQTVVSGPAGALVGTPVTFTADVTIPVLGGAVVAPTGKVTFTASNGGPAVTLGSKHLGPAVCILNLPILPRCQVTLTTNALPVGDVTVTAAYAGNLLTRGSVGSTQLKVLAEAGAPSAPVLVGTDEVGSVKFKWLSGFDGGSPITSYTLYRSDDPTGPFTKVAELLPTGDYQETTIPTNVDFYYKATAANAIGESGFSNQVTGRSLPFGPNSFTSENCPPGEQCWSQTVAAGADDGSVTEVSMNTSPSAGPHLMTLAVGGPTMVACTNPYPGYSATFHDTSVDAFKNVVVDLWGPDAQDMIDNSGFPTSRVGCLGLGVPWKDGPNPGDFADWSPADGLYVGTPAYCSEMAAFETFPGSDLFTEPCVGEAYHYLEEGSGTPIFRLTFQLPPGDGKISGGR